jgi:tetratricopeptide (TPR) repeat protein
MKTEAPFSKSILLLIVSALLIASGPVSSYAQKRGTGQPKSASRAAGLVDEADKMADEKKWPEAIDAYKLAIRLDANYAPAYGGLGDAYFNSGNSEQALVAYKEQVRLAPSDPMAQYDLGYFYNAMGRHGEAFAPLVKATSLDPNFAEAYYGVGYAYLRGEDFEKSISFLKSAVRLKPDYGEAYYGLGQAYARLGKVDLANEQLKKLNTVDPKLARKLEKEMQTAPAAATATAATQTSASTTAATQAPEQPTEKSVPRLVETIQAKPTQQSPKTQSATPQTSTQSETSTAEPASRQLQQLPPPQPPAATSPAATSSATSQAGQIKAFPVSAKRWALVIGVDKYIDPQISPLKGSDNDARMIADSLVRYAGFPQDQVILLATNQPVERQPTRVNILRRLSNLSTAVPKDGMLLVSFAGHGMERGGQAFLLPADAQISDQISFLEETAISMNRVKQWIKETGVGQVVMLLDACRNDPGGRADAPNPLSNAYTNAFNFDVRNREVQAFATVYATGIGQRAYEYTEKKQGYFSWAVVEGLKGGAANEKGEITLSQLVKYVQDAVPKRIAIDLGSTKQQKPFAVIEGYRADELVVAVTNSASNTTNNSTPNVAMVDPAAIELSFWESIKNSNNPDDFKAYLEKYPDGQFASLAKSRTNSVRPTGNAPSGESSEMLYWNAIKDSSNPSDFQAYVTKFPQGLFVELANNRIKSLDAKASGRSPAAAAGLTSGPVTLKDIEVSFKSNMYDETIRTASRFLETTPDSGAAHAYLGLALLARKDAESAVLHLERAIVLGQSVNFPVKRLREPLFGHALDDVSVGVTADSVIIQSGKTLYRAAFSALKESRIGNYQNQCPTAFLKGAFSESSTNSDKQGKPGEKGFNLFPPATTLRQVQQNNLVMNVAYCNGEDGIIPTTIIKLIYRLSANK